MKILIIIAVIVVVFLLLMVLLLNTKTTKPADYIFLAEDGTEFIILAGTGYKNGQKMTDNCVCITGDKNNTIWTKTDTTVWLNGAQINGLGTFIVLDKDDLYITGVDGGLWHCKLATAGQWRRLPAQLKNFAFTVSNGPVIVGVGNDGKFYSGSLTGNFSKVQDDQYKQLAFCRGQLVKLNDVGVYLGEKLILSGNYKSITGNSKTGAAVRSDNVAVFF